VVLTQSTGPEKTESTEDTRESEPLSIRMSTAGRSEGRSIATRFDDGVAGVCGVWMISGLFLDGWAHRNQKPETFFTPWHGLLYSGFLASAIWMLRVARKHQVPGKSLKQTLPIGYGLRSIGVGIFGLGAILDLVWHSLFGIEVSIEALLSPSHLTLVSGGLLMAAGPIVSTMARHDSQEPTWRATGAAVATIGFVVSLMQFFLMYMSPYDPGLYSASVRNEAFSNGGRWLRGEIRTRAVASILIFTLIFVVGLVWMIRNLNPPPGSFIALILVPSILQTLLSSFEGVRTLIGPVIAAIIAELTWPATRKYRHTPWMAGWLGAVMAMMWFGFLGGARLEGQLGWTVSLYSGVPVFAALLTVLLVLGTSRSPSPAPQPQIQKR
jgi:hypothetical protein